MKKHPNIILVVMDSVRADRTSVQGYSRPTTPHLAELAGRGVIFEQAISSAAWTIPSHATLFTGLYPSEHGANHHRIRGDVGPLLAEVLREAGYATIGMVSNTLLHPDSGLTRGFDQFVQVASDPARMRGLKYGRHFARAMGWRDSGAELTNRRIFEAIESASQPFFLFVNYMETHFPFLPPPRFRRRFVRDRLLSWRRFPLALQFMKGRYWSLLGAENAGVFRLLNDLYDGELAHLDWRIGQLLEWLDRRRALEASIVIVTSDHGENLGDHGLLTHHFCLYDSLIHIPLIVTWPGRLPAGERVAGQVSSADLCPSLCRALGLRHSTPPRPGGPRPALLDWDTAAPSGRADAEAYSEYVPPFYLQEWAESNPEVDLDRYGHRIWSLRADGHKCIEGSDGAREVYDLARDPEETMDLSGDASRLASRLAEPTRRAPWRLARGACRG